MYSPAGSTDAKNGREIFLWCLFGLFAAAINLTVPQVYLLARNTNAKYGSEVFYWCIFGVQAVSIYVGLAVALCTGVLSIRDPEFDATLCTMFAVFIGNLSQGILALYKQRRYKSMILNSSHETRGSLKTSNNGQSGSSAEDRVSPV